jgi:hypothetical protein
MESYKKNNNNNIKLQKNSSGTFMMGIGNGTFNSNKLIYHLKNIETEINQKIVGKSSEHLNHSVNTFNNIISKLQTKCNNLNLKVKNFNKDKQEIINMSNKEIIRLKEIISNIYHVVKILTKSFDLSNNDKKTLLEKIRITIEDSPGFLKSINSININVNKLTKNNKQPVTMNKLLSNVNINKIAENIGETKEQIQNSTVPNEYTSLPNQQSQSQTQNQNQQPSNNQQSKNQYQNQQSSNNQQSKNQYQNQQSSNNQQSKNQYQNQQPSNNQQSQTQNKNQQSSNNQQIQSQYKNQQPSNNQHNKNIIYMNKYYEDLKTHNKTYLQKKIQNKKISQNNANILFKNQVNSIK